MYTTILIDDKVIEEIKVVLKTVIEIEVEMSRFKSGLGPRKISPFEKKCKALLKKISNGVVSQKTVSDGFGNECSNCKKDSMEVVRPGRFQCGHCG